LGRRKVRGGWVMTMHEKQKRNNNNKLYKMFFVLFYCILPLVEEEHVNLFSWIQFLFLFLFFYFFILLWWLCGLVGKSCGKKLKWDIQDVKVIARYWRPNVILFMYGHGIA
jgi:hypothetical protein